MHRDRVWNKREREEKKNGDYNLSITTFVTILISNNLPHQNCDKIYGPKSKLKQECFIHMNFESIRST